jgi:cysteinyl-tRNA synthetase
MNSEIWTGILAAASAIVLLSNAAEKIAKAVQAAKAPNARQDERLQDLEEWRKKVDQALAKDLDRFTALDKGERVTQRALLALLDHGIDGNNIEQMQHAKEELQNHLINR